MRGGLRWRRVSTLVNQCVHDGRKKPAYITLSQVVSSRWGLDGSQARQPRMTPQVGRMCASLTPGRASLLADRHVPLMQC